LGKNPLPLALHLLLWLSLVQPLPAPQAGSAPPVLPSPLPPGLLASSGSPPREPLLPLLEPPELAVLRWRLAMLRQRVRNPKCLSVPCRRVDPKPLLVAVR
jgi:hypothetical protein